MRRPHPQQALPRQGDAREKDRRRTRRRRRADNLSPPVEVPLDRSPRRDGNPSHHSRMKAAKIVDLSGMSENDLRPGWRRPNPCRAPYRARDDVRARPFDRIADMVRDLRRRELQLGNRASDRIGRVGWGAARSFLRARSMRSASSAANCRNARSAMTSPVKISPDPWMKPRPKGSRPPADGARVASCGRFMSVFAKTNNSVPSSRRGSKIGMRIFKKCAPSGRHRRV